MVQGDLRRLEPPKLCYRARSPGLATQYKNKALTFINVMKTENKNLTDIESYMAKIWNSRSRLLTSYGHFS